MFNINELRATHLGYLAHQDLIQTGQISADTLPNFLKLLLEIIPVEDGQLAFAANPSYQHTKTQLDRNLEVYFPAVLETCVELFNDALDVDLGKTHLSEKDALKCVRAQRMPALMRYCYDSQAKNHLNHSPYDNAYLKLEIDFTAIRCFALLLRKATSLDLSLKSKSKFVHLYRLGAWMQTTLRKEGETSNLVETSNLINGFWNSTSEHILAHGSLPFLQNDMTELAANTPATAIHELAQTIKTIADYDQKHRTTLLPNEILQSCQAITAAQIRNNEINLSYFLAGQITPHRLLTAKEPSIHFNPIENLRHVVIAVSRGNSKRISPETGTHIQRLLFQNIVGVLKISKDVMMPNNVQEVAHYARILSTLYDTVSLLPGGNSSRIAREEAAIELDKFTKGLSKFRTSYQHPEMQRLLKRSGSLAGPTSPQI